jgi:uncharacterized protein YbaA (DUF1428 family)
MSYVDGFVLVVPKKKVQAYKKMAAMGCKIWREHGALDYKECQGDDMNVKCGVPFPKAFKTKPGETVFFSFIVYKNRKHRDAVNKKVMADKRLTEGMTGEMPFDIKRMCYGGFKTLVQA